jgi:hypothetical protein
LQDFVNSSGKFNSIIIIIDKLKPVLFIMRKYTDQSLPGMGKVIPHSRHPWVLILHCLRRSRPYLQEHPGDYAADAATKSLL